MSRSAGWLTATVVMLGIAAVLLLTGQWSAAIEVAVAAVVCVIIAIRARSLHR